MPALIGICGVLAHSGYNICIIIMINWHWRLEKMAICVTLCNALMLNLKSYCFFAFKNWIAMCCVNTSNA